MSGEWRLREGALENSHVSDERLARLERETGLSRLAIRVCIARGYDSPEKITEFLTPKLENLKDPFLIRDMDLAVERIARIRVSGGLIRIFGDYDVDGTTGAALLSWFFRELGLRSDVRQPDRFKDGYGLNVQAVNEAHADGAELLISVDCGITSFEPATRARELGLDLIVVDHHQVDPARGIPDAVAVLDPHRPDDSSGLTELCGCGLAFYLARALRTHGQREGWWEPGKEPNLKKHLDLVVIATAADMVPLVRDNHILVRHGLSVLKRSYKPGVRALMVGAGLLAKELTPSSLGFTLGPRINASGRLASASLALELLVTEDDRRAAELSVEIERLNTERAVLQNGIADEAVARVIDEESQGLHRFSAVVWDESWHEGVVGIVASRLVERFKRPAIVLSVREGDAKGSTRSARGKDVLEGLRACAHLLNGFGGHRHAAGLSLEISQLSVFREAFDAAMEAQTETKGAATLWSDGQCQLKELNVRALEELERMGPFGPGNPEPVFECRASLKMTRIIKERHVKLSLSERMASPYTLEGIWFHAAEQYQALNLSEATVYGVPELNRFAGKVSPQFRVREVHAGFDASVD
jgi:single-stranded-DNA-specific exonuclease